MNSPHLTDRARYTELANEAGVLLLMYHLMFLTDLSYNAKYTTRDVDAFQQTASNTFLIILVMMFLGNLLVHFSYLAYEQYKACKLR